jgi:hypothetical protein
MTPGGNFKERPRPPDHIMKRERAAFGAALCFHFFIYARRS